MVLFPTNTLKYIYSTLINTSEAVVILCNTQWRAICTFITGYNKFEISIKVTNETHFVLCSQNSRRIRIKQNMQRNGY